MDTIFGHKRIRPEQIEERAKGLWEAYATSVDWKAFNGDPLPQWDEFSTDPAKVKQADGYRAMARHVIQKENEADAGKLEQVIEVLNRAFRVDPNAIHALICNRVPCNEDLMEDPTIGVESPGPINGEEPHAFQVGALGLLNGCLGEILGRTVAVRFGEPNPETGGAKMQGFQAYVPTKKVKE